MLTEALNLLQSMDSRLRQVKRNQEDMDSKLGQVLRNQEVLLGMDARLMRVERSQEELSAMIHILISPPDPTDQKPNEEDRTSPSRVSPYIYPIYI